MKMRLIIPGILIALLIAPAVTLHAEGTLSITHGPYLAQPTDTSVIVTWFTDKNSVSRVEYESDTSTTMTAVSTHHGLIDANTTSHSVELSGLEPGTTYSYRAVSKEIVTFEPYHVTYGDSVTSNTFTFTTLNTRSRSCTFAVFQDVHQHAARVDSMCRHLEFDDIDLVFFNGDTINHFEEESQIFDGFLDVAVERFASETPFVFVRGNHETRGLMARDLDTYFPLRTGRYFYSFDSGPVHFTVLDTGEDKPDDNVEYSGLVAFDPYIDSQTEWLRSEVKSDAFKSAQYRVVVLHLPPIGGNDWYREKYLRKAWLPILNDAGIDLALSGHTHKYAWMEPGYNTNTFPLMTVPPENCMSITAAPTGITISVMDTGGLEVVRKVVAPSTP